MEFPDQTEMIKIAKANLDKREKEYEVYQQKRSEVRKLFVEKAKMLSVETPSIKFDAPNDDQYLLKDVFT